MSAPIDLSVVIPAYLEEENLLEILPRLIKVLAETGLSHEVLVIDTMQPIDNTPAVCKNLGSPIRYLNRTGGNNFGDAKRTGIGAAQGKWILFMDGDGSHSPEFIPRLLAHKDTADLVIASRYVAGGATENSASLVVISRALNIVYSIVLGIKCKDISNSFKLYRADVLKSLELKCDHFDIVEEIFVKYSAKVANPRIVEIPFVFKKRRFGETKRNLLLFVFSFLVTLAWLFAIKVTTRRKMKSIGDVAPAGPR